MASSNRRPAEVLSKALVLSLLAGVVSITLILPVMRLGFKLEIDYNEGWNAYYASRAVSGERIYDSGNQWAPVNYPPLSFYLVGGAGYVFRDNLLAGRIIALSSLTLVGLGVVYLVRKGGGSRFESSISGVVCCGFFVGFATHYVGMNDPQLLAHVWVLAALLVYTQGSRKNEIKYRALLAVALLCSLGLFTKHSLIAAPVAIAADLLLRSRKSFAFWCASVALFVGLFLMLTIWLAGRDFLSHLLVSPEYSFEKLYADSIRFATKMAIPILVLMPWLIRSIKTDTSRTIAFYVICSVAVGLYFTGGVGTDVNMFFDVFVSVAIAGGMLLASVRLRWSGQSVCHMVAYHLVPVLLSAIVFAALYVKFDRVGSSDDFRYGLWRIGLYRELRDRQGDFVQDIAFLASFPDRLVCENLLLVYFAGKSLIYDPFLSGDRMVTGRIDEGAVLDGIRTGTFSVVQLNDRLGERHARGVSGGKAFKESYHLRFTRSFLVELARNYRLVRESLTGAFYVPR